MRQIQKISINILYDIERNVKKEVYNKEQTYNKLEIDLALKEIWDYIRPEEDNVDDGE